MWEREVVEKVSLTSHFVYFVVLKFCCCCCFYCHIFLFFLLSCYLFY